MDIQKQLQNHCCALKRDDDNIFFIPNEFVSHDWYKELHVCANKDFKSISLSVMPKMQNEHQQRLFLVYSTKAKEILTSKYGVGGFGRKQKHLPLFQKVLNKD